MDSLNFPKEALDGLNGNFYCHDTTIKLFLHALAGKGWK